MSVLFAAITGAILVAAGPARAASGIDADPSYRDPFSVSDQRTVDEDDVPRSLSFKFASLYSHIADTAARIVDLTGLERSRLPSLGLNISFQPIDPASDAGHLATETRRRFFPGVEDSSGERFSLQIGISDDGAPLLDPARRKAGEPLRDHIWIFLGARYGHSDRLSLDIGYEHLWVNETAVDGPSGVSNDILEDYRSAMDLIGARLRWAFD